MQLMASKPTPDVNKNGIGIFVYDGINSMDALGPYRVFKTAGLNVFLVAEHKGSITTNDQLTIQIDKSTAEVDRLDVLVMPGGAFETAVQTTNLNTLEWVKKIDQNSVYTTSVCSGAWILGAAGLLQGKSATTNWYRAKDILTKYGAKFVKERWVQDGKYWTSAGVSAGIDMAFAIVHKLLGKDFTQAVMLELEYDPKSPIEGGSVDKTKPRVFRAMQYMYDYYLLPFINSIP